MVPRVWFLRPGVGGFLDLSTYGVNVVKDCGIKAVSSCEVLLHCAT